MVVYQGNGSRGIGRSDINLNAYLNGAAVGGIAGLNEGGVIEYCYSDSFFNVGSKLIINLPSVDSALALLSLS